MPRFHELIDQERPLRILSGILTKGNIPHAFLLTGIDGIGKRSTAIHFAMARNCHGLKHDGGASGTRDMMTTPCGQCGACVKIMAGSHPDVLMIEPAGDVIKIAQIRELSRRLAFQPQEGGAARVVIISDAQAMNVEAANALLKALEEPPPLTFFFLTAGQPADLLPTVVSRCQHIRFNPVSTEKIERFLTEHHGISPTTARPAAILADGSMARALDLSERPETLHGMERRRQWLAAEMAGLPSYPIPRILLFAQKLAADKNDLPDFLRLIKGLLRDAAICGTCPEKLINTDLREAIEEMARKNSLSAIFDKITAVEEADQAIRQHANQRLTLEALSIRLADIAA
ncbi:MAG: DNA polymerase III subunit delta' [Thermodesulfobacteriota bacterium]